MGDHGKKISFGFSRVAKKSNIKPTASSKECNVQFIECVEGNSIKVIGEENNSAGGPLIIPMKNENSLTDSIITVVNSRTNIKNDSSEKDDCNSEKTAESKTLTLDELAAKEILEDLKASSKEEVKIYSVPLPIKQVEDEKESTLEDYESVPVSQFGLAVLRGMGWDPQKGIGKNNRVVRPSSPILRPKGMGLGADKLIAQKQVKDSEESSVIVKGSSVKFLAGQNKNMYAKVEGFDEIPGRLTVKLAIGGSLVSVSEFMVVVVPLEEYNKNSNVINIIKYDEYKNKETRGGESLNIENVEEIENCRGRKDDSPKRKSHSAQSSQNDRKEPYKRRKSRSPLPLPKHHLKSRSHSKNKSIHHHLKSRKKISSTSSSDSEDSKKYISQKHKKYECSSRDYKKSSSKKKKKKHKIRKHRSRSRS